MLLTDLPPEILVRIASFVPAETTLMLRLANTTLSACAFDHFAEEYLEKLTCCFVDPSRLQRLKRITSKPHLLAKICMVDFTMKALEGHRHDEIPFAPPRVLDTDAHRPNNMSYDDLRDHHMYNTLVPYHRSMSQFLLDQPLLASVLVDIKNHPKLESLRVSLNFASGMPRSDDPISQTLHETFRAIIASSCPVKRIIMCDCSRMLPVQLGIPQFYTFADMCANIREILYFSHWDETELAVLQDEDEPNVAEVLAETREDFLKMLGLSKNLRVLMLELTCYSDQVMTKEMVAKALQMSTVANLQRLALVGCHVDPSILTCALRSMRHSLKDFGMHQVVLNPAERVGSSLLRTLLEATHLQILSMSRVYECQRFGTKLITFKDGPARLSHCDDALTIDGQPDRAHLVKALQWHIDEDVLYLPAE